MFGKKGPDFQRKRFKQRKNGLFLKIAHFEKTIAKKSVRMLM
ncbi:hypothetical protein CDIMF43_200220 [Carnobacterium divergens]|nr:hypothetical protein CDIMF43_200220 [Carnobacterium divergens]